MKHSMTTAIFLTGQLLSAAACGDQESMSTGTMDTVSETDVQTERIPLLEQLPTVDYDGYIMRILVREGMHLETDVITYGEETGEVFNDIVYRRNRAVEEKYNITIEGYADAYEMTTKLFRQQVQSGLNDYEFYYAPIQILSIASDGFLARINELPHVNLSGEWWDQAAVEGLSVGGELYIATGDISPCSLLMTTVLAFNKRLFDQVNIEYPYDMVTEGTWTLDRLLEITEGLTADLNGDGVINYESDMYGYVSCHLASPFALFYGAGGTLSGKDENDIPYVNFDIEHITKIYDKMYALIVDNQSYFVSDTSQYHTPYSCFSGGHAYFCDITLRSIDASLRDMEDDYGIFPYPKMDEENSYRSFVQGAGSVIAVPSYMEDEERTGLLVEAMAVASYENITPLLYESIVKARNVCDEKSAQMLNIAIRNRVFDIIYFNQFSCVGVFGTRPA